MRLRINENENNTPSKDKYILYHRGSVPEEFDDYQEAVKAYDSCRNETRFLYQPDKRYFIVTLSASGYESYRHTPRRTTAKATGVFIAKNINQIKKFLANYANWRFDNSPDATKYRIYIGGYGMNPVCSDTEWERFNMECRRGFDYWYSYDTDFGAVDVNSANEHIKYSMPFRPF